MLREPPSPGAHSRASRELTRDNSPTRAGGLGVSSQGSAGLALERGPPLTPNSAAADFDSRARQCKENAWL